MRQQKISPGVLAEYHKIADWLEKQANTLGPVGDTMHGLAAEAFSDLLAREEARS